MSSASSAFDVRETDLVKYKRTLTELEEHSMDLDDTMEKWPANESEAVDPRWLKARHDKDIVNEHRQMQRVEALLERYREVKERIDEVRNQ